MAAPRRSFEIIWSGPMYRLMAQELVPLGFRATGMFKQTPFSARGEFTETLDAMAELLIEATRETGGERLGQLKKVPRPRLIEALEKVGEARELAQSNVNPQLLLATLNLDLSEVL